MPKCCETIKSAFSKLLIIIKELMGCKIFLLMTREGSVQDILSPNLGEQSFFVLEIHTDITDRDLRIVHGKVSVMKHSAILS